MPIVILKSGAIASRKRGVVQQTAQDLGRLEFLRAKSGLKNSRKRALVRERATGKEIDCRKAVFRPGMDRQMGLGQYEDSADAIG